MISSLITIIIVRKLTSVRFRLLKISKVNHLNHGFTCMVRDSVVSMKRMIMIGKRKVSMMVLINLIKKMKLLLSRWRKECRKFHVRIGPRIKFGFLSTYK